MPPAKQNHPLVLLSRREGAVTQGTGSEAAVVAFVAFITDAALKYIHATQEQRRTGANHQYMTETSVHMYHSSTRTAEEGIFATYTPSPCSFFFGMEESTEKIAYITSHGTHSL